MTGLPVPETIFEVVEIDFLHMPALDDGHGGEWDFIMVVVDLLSGFLVTIPTSKKGLTTGKAAKLFMDHVVFRYGCPSRLITDQDVRFTAAWWKEMMGAMGISHHLSLAYRPQGHGAVERANKTIVDMFKAVLLGRADCNWMAQLARVTWLLNDQPRQSGWSANKVVFGRELVSLEDQVHARTGAVDGDEWVESQLRSLEEMRVRMETEKRRMEERYNRKRQCLELQPEDHVWIYREVGDEDRLDRKLLPRWRGPYRVTRAIHFPNVWEVEIDGVPSAHHVEHLKLASEGIPVGWVK